MSYIYINDKYYSVDILKKIPYNERVLVLARYYRNKRTIEELANKKEDTKLRFVLLSSVDTKDNGFRDHTKVLQTFKEMIGYLSYEINSIRSSTYMLDINTHDLYLNLLDMKDLVTNLLSSNPDHDKLALELNVPLSDYYHTP